MWPFKKKEPVKQFSRFSKLDFCNSCKALEEEFSFGTCCPKCGSEDFEKKIARWEFHWVHSGLGGWRVNDRYELLECD